MSFYGYEYEMLGEHSGNIKSISKSEFVRVDLRGLNEGF